MSTIDKYTLLHMFIIKKRNSVDLISNDHNRFNLLLAFRSYISFNYIIKYNSNI